MPDDPTTDGSGTTLQDWLALGEVVDAAAMQWYQALNPRPPQSLYGAVYGTPYGGVYGGSSSSSGLLLLLLAGLVVFAIAKR